MVLAPRGTKIFGLGRFERSSSYELAPLLDLMKIDENGYLTGASK